MVLCMCLLWYTIEYFLLLRVVPLSKDLFIWQYILSFSVIVNPSQNIEYDAIEYEKNYDKQHVPKSTVDYPTCFPDPS